MARAQIPFWLDFLDKSNITVTLGVAGFIIATRSAAAAYTSAGALVCVGTAKIVKRILRHPRPKVIEGAPQKRSYGMPSTHSSAMSFFATFIVLACIRLPIHSSLPSSIVTRILPPVIAVPSAALVVMSRVWLGHHTRRQVVAGASYGVAFAYVWFTLWTSGLNEYGREFEKIVEYGDFVLTRCVTRDGL